MELCQEGEKSHLQLTARQAGEFTSHIKYQKTDFLCKLFFFVLNRGGNVVLLHFLLGLRTATEDEMVADLLVNILKVCPDLLNRYFKETHYSFVPRVSPAWMDNVKLLKRVRVWMMVKNHAQSRRLCRHLN